MRKTLRKAGLLAVLVPAAVILAAAVMPLGIAGPLGVMVLALSAGAMAAATVMTCCWLESRKGKDDQLRHALDRMADLYYQADGMGRLVYCTAASSKVLGYPPDEAVGRAVTSFYVEPEDRGRLLAKMVANHGSVANYETRLKHRDGHEIWVSTSSQFILGERGDVVGIEGILRVVEERKQIEKGLRDAQSLIQALLDVAPDAIMLMDREGHLLSTNSVVSERLGLPAEELVGKVMWQFFPADLIESRRQSVETVFRTGKPVMLSDVRDGRHYDNHIHPVFAQDGQVAQVAVFSRDVTSRVAAAQELADSEEMYRTMFDDLPVVKLRTDPQTGAIIDANKAAADYYGWSQERLRTMRVSDLNLWAPDRSLSQMKLVESGDCRFFQARHRLATGETRDVEVYSAPILARGKTFLHSIVIDATDRRRAERSLSDAKYRSDLAARAKSEFVAMLGHDIRTPLNTVLGMSQLLNTSRLDPKQRSWVDGILQSSDDLLSVFEDILEFTSLDADKFDTWLPLGEAIPRSTLTPKRLLLCEDNVVIRKMTTAMLRHWGHSVTAVADGLEGFEAARSQGFDLLLIDVDLPNLDGPDMARMLREANVQTPILALAAVASPQAVQRYLDSGMTSYLVKPFSTHMLLEAMTGLLSKTVN